MTYDELYTAVQSKPNITRPAEKRFQREENSEIRYKNPDTNILEVQLHSGQVVSVKFLTQEGAAYAEAHPTPTPVDRDAE
jgi:hypothetical protein